MGRVLKIHQNTLLVFKLSTIMDIPFHGEKENITFFLEMSKQKELRLLNLPVMVNDKGMMMFILFRSSPDLCVNSSFSCRNESTVAVIDDHI